MLARRSDGRHHLRLCYKGNTAATPKVQQCEDKHTQKKRPEREKKRKRKQKKEKGDKRAPCCRSGVVVEKRRKKINRSTTSARKEGRKEQRRRNGWSSYSTSTSRLGASLVMLRACYLCSTSSSRNQFQLARTEQTALP